MAMTSAGALKAFIEGLGLSITVFRDEAPDGQAYPYVTVAEAIATVPDLNGTPWNKSSPATVVEHAQVDVWQTWKNADNSRAENYTLAPAIKRALHGSKLPATPTRAWGVKLVNAVHLLERDNNVVHDAITVAIYRDL